MTWKLGRIAGIPMFVHWSFWLLPLLLILSGNTWGMSPALQMMVLFAVFGCVLLHELGHAMMARYFGIPTRDITLYPIGGVARLERMPRKAKAEGLIALAGPAVNVVIAAALVLFQLTPLASIFGVAGQTFVGSLLYANIALVLFNLLPAFPLDGGRVFRAFISHFTGHLRATEIAASVGQVLAIGLGLLGLFTGGTLIFIAIFIFFAGKAELAMVRAESRGDFWHAQAPPPFSYRSTESQNTGHAARGQYVLLDRNGRPIVRYNSR